MDKILHITNGDSAVKLMDQARISGEILPWRDVLHDGPVPLASTLGELSQVRASFVADCGWGEYSEVLKGFQERDKTLEDIDAFDRITLWFEHDLYDQLQILQILDSICEFNNTNIPVSLICTNQYLGMLTPEAILALREYEQPVTGRQFELAARAWSAFRDSSPERWNELMYEDTSALPFLYDAVVRLLEEYPSHQKGLSRTEEQALTLIAAGEQQPGKLFVENQQLEQQIFMGDASFFLRLNNLIGAEQPLLILNESETISRSNLGHQRLSLTELGRRVLAGRENWLDQNTANWWIGGTLLTPENRWCWDSDQERIMKYNI